MSLNYNTVLQLDQFCRRQGRWVEVAYVLPFFSLRGMSDLCPKGIVLGMKPSAPSCPPTFPPYSGLQTEQTESQRTLLGRVALVSVKTQTEVQTAQVEVQTTPVSVQPQNSEVSKETQTIEVIRAMTGLQIQLLYLLSSLCFPQDISWLLFLAVLLMRETGSDLHTPIGNVF